MMTQHVQVMINIPTTLILALLGLVRSKARLMPRKSVYDQAQRLNKDVFLEP